MDMTTLAWLLFRRVLMTLHPDNRNPHTHMHMNIFSGMSGCICDTYVCKCTSLDIFRYIRPLTFGKLGKFRSCIRGGRVTF